LRTITHGDPGKPIASLRWWIGGLLFASTVIIAGLLPFIGMILVLLLVRNTQATDQGLVRRI
jgi:hypothetical protein